jgi:hypothetical protein
MYMILRVYIYILVFLYNVNTGTLCLDESQAFIEGLTAIAPLGLAISRFDI